jgi:hypothetical protein
MKIRMQFAVLALTLVSSLYAQDIRRLPETVELSMQHSKVFAPRFGEAIVMGGEREIIGLHFDDNPRTPQYTGEVSGQGVGLNVFNGRLDSWTTQINLDDIFSVLFVVGEFKPSQAPRRVASHGGNSIALNIDSGWVEISSQTFKRLPNGAALAHGACQSDCRVCGQAARASGGGAWLPVIANQDTLQLRRISEQGLLADVHSLGRVAVDNCVLQRSKDQSLLLQYSGGVSNATLRIDDSAAPRVLSANAPPTLPQATAANLEGGDSVEFFFEGEQAVVRRMAPGLWADGAFTQPPTERYRRTLGNVRPTLMASTDSQLVIQAGIEQLWLNQQGEIVATGATWIAADFAPSGELAVLMGADNPLAARRMQWFSRNGVPLALSETLQANRREPDVLSGLPGAPDQFLSFARYSATDTRTRVTRHDLSGDQLIGTLPSSSNGFLGGRFGKIMRSELSLPNSILSLYRSVDLSLIAQCPIALTGRVVDLPGGYAVSDRSFELYTTQCQNVGRFPNSRLIDFDVLNATPGIDAGTVRFGLDTDGSGFAVIDRLPNGQLVDRLRRTDLRMRDVRIDGSVLARNFENKHVLFRADFSPQTLPELCRSESAIVDFEGGCWRLTQEPRALTHINAAGMALSTQTTAFVSNNDSIVGASGNTLLITENKRVVLYRRVGDKLQEARSIPFQLTGAFGRSIDSQSLWFSGYEFGSDPLKRAVERVQLPTQFVDSPLFADSFE